MAVKLLLDVSDIDPSRVVIGMDEIRKVNPQRGDMEQLDGILLYQPEGNLIVGIKHARHDEFWVPGHIPGKPLMPGVLMLEAAAQLCNYFFARNRAGRDDFMAFGGIDAARFRSPVLPGQTLILVARARAVRHNFGVFDTQGIVRVRDAECRMQNAEEEGMARAAAPPQHRLAFEAIVKGVTM